MIKILKIAARGLLWAGSLALLGVSVAGRFDFNRQLTEFFSHFPVQYLCIGLLALPVAGGLRSRAWLPLAAAVGINAAVVLPFLGFFGQTGAAAAVGERPLRLMTANVFFLTREDADMFAAFRQQNPDFLILQEVTPPFDSTFRRHFARQFPYLHSFDSHEGYRMIAAARFPLVIDSLSAGQPQAFVVKMALPGADTLLLPTAHPIPPFNQTLFRQRNATLAAAFAVAGRTPTRPVALIGDLNISGYTPSFLVQEKKYGLVSMRRGRGLLHTFPANFPVWTRIPIDHVLLNARVRPLALHRVPLGGSDHFGLLAEVAVSR